MENVGNTMSALFPNSVKATWINVWIASSEKHWFDPDNLNGTRIFLGDEKKAINWDEDAQVRQHLRQIKDAGVDVVLFDLTNGFHDFIIERSRRIGRVCREYGLKLAFAAGNADDDGFEWRAKLTWEEFAGDGAPFEDVYFRYDGKPVLILYVIPEQYKRLAARTEGFLPRFHRGWASGEDPAPDKWGWQLTPEVGSMPSDGVMYITPSLWWEHAERENWHKSLSYLDYNFLKAQQNQPRLLIVGSFDDVCERNSWMPVDTTDAPEWLKQRNPAGDIDPLYYYHRVCDWLADGPRTVPGGALADGAYRLQTADGLSLTVDTQEDKSGALVKAAVPSADWQRTVWLYHLGNNEYRVLRMFAGKSLEVSSDGLIQNDDRNDPAQRWHMVPENNAWRIQNAGTGEDLLGKRWELLPELTI